MWRGWNRSCLKFYQDILDLFSHTSTTVNSKTMETHKETVAVLASQVAKFSASNTPFRIYHGSTLSTRESSRRRNQIIDVSSLNHVLQFGKAKKTVLVEPNVPMDELVKATLKEGLLPKVVMELPNITVGGGYVSTNASTVDIPLQGCTACYGLERILVADNFRYANI